MPFARILALLLTTALASGCAAYERDVITDHENNLSAAGFTVLPTSTPARQEMLARLPPHQILQRIEGEHVTYLYADPTLCRCIYVGGQAAFGQFQKVMQERRIAADQLQAAQINRDAGFGWGPWGGYSPGFY